MKKWLPALALICVAAGLAGYWFLRPAASLTSAAAPQVSGAVEQASAVESGKARPPAETRLAVPKPESASNPGSAPPAATIVPASTKQPPLPYQLGSAGSLPTGVSPASILESARLTVINYGSRFDGNPVGNNAEITAALNGGNPGQVKFISEDTGLRINGQGELVDAWGTPFFFHQLSGSQMEIRSAGPDKKMWTADDLVTK